MENLLLNLLDKFCGAIVSLPLVLIYIFVFDRERAKRRWGWMALLTLYLNAMYIVIGVPGIQYICWDPTLNLIPFQDFSASNIAGMILNAVMFAPLGFLLPAYFECYRRWNRTIAAGFLTSLAVEAIQLFTFRATDVDDLIMNTLGAYLGYVISWAFFHKKWARDPEPDPGRVNSWCSLVISILIPMLVIVFLRTLLSDWIYGLRLFD